MKKILTLILSLTIICSLCGCTPTVPIPNPIQNQSTSIETTLKEETSTLEILPTYKIKISENLEIDSFNGNPYIEINDNIPFFTESDYTTEPFEYYSELDSLGRCGVTYANICIDIMPTEERGEIGHIKPTGWHTIKYDIVDGKYLYNRCHLIGFQLAGENDNEKNLITGTRYLNIDGMLDFENMIANYVKETSNHVLYRVTPIYTGDNLLADGVLMEAYSIEDNGEGICFNVFAYNAHPGIYINYENGESYLLGTTPEDVSDEKIYTANEEGIIYILNTNSKKYHLDSCGSVDKISEHNKETFNGTIEWLEDNGYEPCGSCKPNE